MKPVILIHKMGIFAAYHHWGCPSIYRPLSYLSRSIVFFIYERVGSCGYEAAVSGWRSPRLDLPIEYGLTNVGMNLQMWMMVQLESRPNTLQSAPYIRDYLDFCSSFNSVLYLKVPL